MHSVLDLFLKIIDKVKIMEEMCRDKEKKKVERRGERKLRVFFNYSYYNFVMYTKGFILSFIQIKHLY
jgi:hypothetical protein